MDRRLQLHVQVQYMFFYIIDNYLLSLRDASMLLLWSSCFLKSVGLSHQTFQEFYEMYVNWSEDPVHLSSFRRIYMKSTWQDKLRIADSQHHGKCSTCERLKMLRKQVTTSTQEKQVQEAHSGHVKSVMLDRNCDALAQQLGADSVQVCGGVPKIPNRERALLSWTQDSMDQAKFRCPRHVSMAKVLADSWRPQLAAHGIIIDGVGKMLFWQIWMSEKVQTFSAQ